MGHPERPQPSRDESQEMQAPAQDPHMLALYERHGLGTHPTVARCRQEAIYLLPVEATLRDGAELMLGRPLDLTSPADQELYQTLRTFTNGPHRGNYLLSLMRPPSDTLPISYS